MSSGTAAQPRDTTASAAVPGQVPSGPGGARSSSDAGPPGRRPRRPGRGWTLVTIAAAVLFCAALVFGAARLLPRTADVSDSPEHTVRAFLAALLDERDATAASRWLCADKADRDLGAAVERMSSSEVPGTFAWGGVAETARSVGTATVAAEIRVDPGGGAVAPEPATWVFTLVAEQGEPQWLICGIAAARES